MKKILVFLLLITGLVKAQVVIPKSTTTFSNIVATGNATVNGTLKVNGTSTLTGNVTTSSITSTGNLDLGCATGSVVSLKNGSSNILQASSSSLFLPNKTRIGSFSTPSANLDVTGTMSVSSSATVSGVFTCQSNIQTTGAGKLTIAASANNLGNLTLVSSATNTLTTGNTGTIAVLSDAVFPVMFNAQSTSLTDGNTYYCNTINRGLSTSASTGLLYLPYNVTLVGYSINFFTTGTLGSAENMTVSISGTAPDVLLLSNVTVTTAITTYTASGLNQDFNAGTGIETKIGCPTWATNPTNVHVATTYWFVRRQ